MAKYAYAPLSVETGSGARRHPQEDSPAAGHHHSKDEDDLVNERMPMCVGICVLLAIVYVLSRTGDASAGAAATTASATGIRASSVGVATVPEGTAQSAPSVIQAMPNPPVIQVQGGETTMNAMQAGSTIIYPPVIQTVATPMPPVIQMTAGTVPPPPPAPTDCNCEIAAPVNNIQDPNALMAELREKALANSPPHIIECSAAAAGESQAACHLPATIRYAALSQKGATIWMTGCSGAGKTTIATALESQLVKLYGKHVYRLDGDNLRTGLNRDLSFSASDRAESVRRTGELATLFSDAGVITLVGLISPYRAERDKVRLRHEQQGIPFYEVFLDVPIEELFSRDPKGQYAKVLSGELKHFTCIDDPYEPPLAPEIVLKTHELEIEQSVQLLFRRLERDGILMGAPKISIAAKSTTIIDGTGAASTTTSSLPNPDGDILVDLHVPPELRAQRIQEAATLPKVLLTDIDLNWLQVIGEGWASPLQGFMREGTLLETLHFNSILVDPFNLTGNVDRLTTPTDFSHFTPHAPPTRVSMPIPITLSLTSFTKKRIEDSGASAVALVTRMGQTVAILRHPEIYENRKEEIVTRMFGVIDVDHPYIHNIYMGGDYLIGGEVELLDRIRYNDGLDSWRKTAQELVLEFQEKGADTVYAFQTRNPTHAGHAFLMKQAGEALMREQGYKKPVLWLSPLGGWTKPDDVPLDVRVQQHVEVLNAGTSHPGGLDPATTVMAIWPAPMVYAGPTEVQFHAKSRRCAGASYFVVGRDPAGMKGSPNAVAHPDDDLYNGDHGRYVLQYSPGLGDMKMLSFVKVMYDISDNIMKIPDESRLDDFISISGTKMRALAKQGAHLCSPDNIPTDLLEANCIPSGFMVPKGWDLVVDYYKNEANATRFVPWSQPFVTPVTCKHTHQTGRFGSSTFELYSDDAPSFWHDVPLRPVTEPETSNIINVVTEIPMYMAAKMEVQKTVKSNPIKQDTNKDGSPRYYTYGVPFFNYGFVPQTWEDPDQKSVRTGLGADNDPLDIMEVGSMPLPMGSIRPCRVLGSLELMDEGETDHKILCIALTDPQADLIHSLEDLERVKPGHVGLLRDWLKRYKTSDGKAENLLASDIPRSSQEAMQVVQECNDRWKVLCGKDGTHRSSLSASTEGFWLESPGCRGAAY
jgi:3'-phosphoadenosine 5'-phosphosulfate synthase